MAEGPLGGPRPLADDEVRLLVSIGVENEVTKDKLVDVRSKVASEVSDEDVGVQTREPLEGDIEVFGTRTEQVVDVDIIFKRISIPLRELENIKDFIEDSLPNSTGSSAVIGGK